MKLLILIFLIGSILCGCATEKSNYRRTLALYPECENAGLAGFQTCVDEIIKKEGKPRGESLR